MPFVGLVLFLIFAFLSAYCLKEILIGKCLKLTSDVARLDSTLEGSKLSNKALEKEINSASQVLTKTVRLYEAARDICASLDEEKLFSNFKEDLKKFIDYKDCFLAPNDGFDAAKYPQSAVFNLAVKERLFGYLVIAGVSQEENPYLAILAGNFALGLKRARLYRMVQELAITDSLTGLYTRRYAVERLKEEFNRSQAHNFNLSFLMIDVDNFKECNDKSGHLVGDIILAEIARRVKDNIREVDMLARFGGEEFMVFAPNTSKESAAIIAERIRHGVELELIRAYDEKLKMTVSVGLATYPEDAKNVEDLIGKADWALYQAKKLGKNKVSIFGAFHE